MQARAPAPVAVTMGEPAGIGGELSLAAWRRKDNGLPPFFVIDDPERLRRLGAETNLPSDIIEITAPSEAIDRFADGLPVLALSAPVKSHPGTPSSDTAPMVLESIERAVEYAKSGSASSVVTNPIYKETLYECGFPYPGHTEFLADRAGGGHSVMMLAGPGIRVVPVTIHMALRDVLETLDEEQIIRCARTTDEALRKNFAIKNPRLAVSGLNPHAGEGGHLGREEITLIIPALEKLKEEGVNVIGPLPADTMFHETARAQYDAAICMYHDQALIPVKALAFDQAVNVTLGLSIIRTSPDHGTAFDLAGTGKADPGSFCAALKMAAEMAG